MAWLLSLDNMPAPRMLRDGWFRLGPDGQWHPVERFMLASDEDEARTVQMCFPGQSVEFRGASPAVETTDDELQRVRQNPRSQVKA
jgi:hypothetical protein